MALSISSKYLTVFNTRYVVSPPGLGWDCYRTWESVLFGAIPIVLHNPGMEMLYKQSPAMVVHDWKEVTRLVDVKGLCPPSAEYYDSSFSKSLCKVWLS